MDKRPSDLISKFISNEDKDFMLSKVCVTYMAVISSEEAAEEIAAVELLSLFNENIDALVDSNSRACSFIRNNSADSFSKRSGIL
ncbi:hypothetical protein SDC9_180054 [bioreactor metagenome]|uniref:Uncharacterized protein n=1 Tax=bioreactor metagenome TaxID=1076179 RepID=A0A645H8H8_9ZZZZ